MKKKKTTIKYKQNSPLNYQFGGLNIPFLNGNSSEETSIPFLDQYQKLNKQWGDFWKGGNYFSPGSPPEVGATPNGYQDPKAMLFNTVENNNRITSAYQANQKVLKDNPYTGDWGPEAHTYYYNKTLNGTYSDSQLQGFNNLFNQKFDRDPQAAQDFATANGIKISDYQDWYRGRETYAPSAGAHFDNERGHRNKALAEQPEINKQMGAAFTNTASGIFQGLNYQNAYKKPEPISLNQGFQGVQYAQYGDEIGPSLSNYSVTSENPEQTINAFQGSRANDINFQRRGVRLPSEFNTVMDNNDILEAVVGLQGTSKSVLKKMSKNKLIDLLKINSKTILGTSTQQGLQEGVSSWEHGGNINLTGYTPGSLTQFNRSNTIPGGDISMKDMDRDLIGIVKGGGKHGLITKLEKGKEYNFGSKSVTELPIEPTKEQPMEYAQFGANIVGLDQLAQQAKDKYLSEIAGDAQYGPDRSSIEFNNRMQRANDNALAHSSGAYYQQGAPLGKPAEEYNPYGFVDGATAPQVGQNPMQTAGMKALINSGFVPGTLPGMGFKKPYVYGPNTSSDFSCPEGVDCTEQYPTITLKNDSKYEYSKDNNGNWLTRRQGTNNQWVNINTTKKLSNTNRQKALTTLTNAETGKTKGSNVSVIAPRYIDVNKAQDSYYDAIKQHGHNDPRTQAALKEADRAFNSLSKSEQDILINEKDNPQVNTPSVQNTGALSQPQIPISSISTPTYNSNTNTTTSNNIASTILDFEDRQGSANGTHLDNYGINKDKWSKKYSYLNKNTISKKDAERFINDEYLPKVKNYPPEIQKRLVDYMYNSGRSPQDLLLYADGKITLDQINSSEVFTDKWKSYKTDIENKMNDPEFISKLNSARDNVARTTNMINGETNPAYEKTWYDRVRMFDPVKTSYNENRKIDNINSSNTNKSFSSINDRYSSDNVLSNNTPVNNPNSPTNNPNSGDYDAQGRWNPSTANKPEGVTFINKRGETYIETDSGQIIKYTGNSYIPLRSDEEKKYRASRKNQKGDWSKVENKQYGGLVSLVPNFQFGGPINNDYTYPIHPITEEFTEIQTEKGEVVSLPDFTIVNVKADKLHKHVDKNDVTDILPAEAYVFSDDDKMKLSLDDKIGGVAIRDMRLGKSVFEYKENEITAGPTDIYFSKLWGNEKELTPAQLVNKVKKKLEVRDQKNDFFVERANMENKEQRKEYLDIIKALSEYKKPRSKRVPKAQYGMNISNMNAGLPKMYNQPTNNALDGLFGYTNKAMDPYYGMDNNVKSMYNISSSMDSKLFEKGGSVPEAQFGWIGAGVDAIGGWSARAKRRQEQENQRNLGRYNELTGEYIDSVERTGVIDTGGALASYMAALNVPDLKYNDNSGALATMSDSYNRQNAMLNAQKYSAVNGAGSAASLARYTNPNNMGAYLAAMQGNTDQQVAAITDRQAQLEANRAGTIADLQGRGLDNYNSIYNNKASQLYNANVSGIGNVGRAASTANANLGNANYQTGIDTLSYEAYLNDKAQAAFDKSRSKIEGYANEIGGGVAAVLGVPGFGGSGDGSGQQMGTTTLNGQTVPSNFNSQFTSPASQQFNSNYGTSFTLPSMSAPLPGYSYSADMVNRDNVWDTSSWGFNPLTGQPLNRR